VGLPAIWTAEADPGLRRRPGGDVEDVPRPPHRGVLAVAVVVVILLSGCGTIVVGQSRPSEPASQRPGGTGEVIVIGAREGTADDQARDALADLETFWAQTFPEVYGEEFLPPEGGYFSVDPNDIDLSEYPGGVVGCGAQPLSVENNAFYCLAGDEPNSDSISYDREFLAELAADYGEFVPALVMAHEFGHAVQGRVGQPGPSIATETQADCFAGAWTRWVAAGEAENSQLRGPELDQLLRGYLLLRDPVGTSTAAESAHGSYFDRVSAFQEGFDSGPEACRDNFGPDRVFTQGSFQDDAEALSGGNAEYDVLLGIVEDSLPTVWDKAFRDVFGEDFTPPDIEAFDGDAPDCADDADRELVHCAADDLVGFDETDLGRPAYSDIGDFALATAIAIPYSLEVREQLGLSTDDEEAVRSALCLTGWYAAKVFNRQAGSDVIISPGDLDESVQFLLTYGNDPAVLPDVDLSGFQQVDLFRGGFIEGLAACDVGV
jgi:predicted metalloprotease